MKVWYQKSFILPARKATVGISRAKEFIGKYSVKLKVPEGWGGVVECERSTPAKAAPEF